MFLVGLKGLLSQLDDSLVFLPAGSRKVQVHVSSRATGHQLILSYLGS